MRNPLISCLAATVLLTGCVSVLPEPSAPDALYRITAGTSLDGLSHNLIVREPEAPRVMAGQGMVSEGADGGLRLVPDVEWAGSATRQLQLAMIDSFVVTPAANALLPETGIVADYELATRIKTFALSGNTATCALTASLISTTGRDLVEMTEITARNTAATRSGRDRALALQQAGADCTRQAAAFAIKAQTKNSYAAEVDAAD